MLSDFVEYGMEETVKNLPLIIYNYLNNRFTQSNSSDEGLTIYDRINIVKEGEDGSIQSCIRMTSNKFVSSAYYYMRLLSLYVPFHISDVSYIS